MSPEAYHPLLAPAPPAAPGGADQGPDAAAPASGLPSQADTAVLRTLDRVREIGDCLHFGAYATARAKVRDLARDLHAALRAAGGGA